MLLSSRIVELLDLKKKKQKLYQDQKRGQRIICQLKTQYILRRLLLFTLTYFAKCQLFSTFLLSNIILFPNEPLLFMPTYLLVPDQV